MLSSSAMMASTAGLSRGAGTGLAFQPKIEPQLQMPAQGTGIPRVALPPSTNAQHQFAQPSRSLIPSTPMSDAHSMSNVSVRSSTYAAGESSRAHAMVRTDSNNSYGNQSMRSQLSGTSANFGNIGVIGSSGSSIGSVNDLNMRDDASHVGPYLDATSSPGFIQRVCFSS